MKLGKRSIIISSIIVVLIAISIATVAIINSKIKKPGNLLKTLPDVDLKIKGFSYTEVGEANEKLEAKAEIATYDKKQNLAIFDRVQIKLTTSDGKVFAMSADKGRMFTDKKNIEIENNVVIISDAGDKFSMDHLSYNDAEKKFYTDAPVTMENKRMKITGKGLSIFVNKGELNIPSTVKARII
jgi:LPS export ABC transporter protein LptC